jgi:hypothetical protein
MADWLTLNFQGADGATSWTEEAQGLTPDTSTLCELDTAQAYTGTSSLLLVGNIGELALGGCQYTVPGFDPTSMHFEFSLRVATGCYAASVYLGDSGGNYGIVIGYSDGVGGQCEITDSGQNIVVSETPSIALDAWHKCEVDINGTYVSVKIDNVVIGSGTATGGESFSGIDLLILGGFESSWIGHVLIQDPVPETAIVSSNLSLEAHHDAPDAGLEPVASVSATTTWTGTRESGLAATGGLTADCEFGYFARLNASLPMLVLTPRTGLRAELTLPALTVSGTLTSDYAVRARLTLPRLLVSGNVQSGYVATANLTLPALRLVGTLDTGTILTLSRSLPIFTLSSNVMQGEIASLNASLPALSLSAAILQSEALTLAASLPGLRLAGHVDTGNRLYLVVNESNLALTEFETYPFNSMAEFGGKNFAAGATGIYLLEGSFDDGAITEWEIKPGTLDLVKDGARRYVRYILLACRPSGDAMLVVTTEDGSQYEYAVETVGETNQEIRVKVGKGLRGRYLDIALRQGEDGGSLFLDKFEVHSDPVPVGRNWK